jgi:malate dehydrogenase (oxaloacetate-decarboxylating)
MMNEASDRGANHTASVRTNARGDALLNDAMVNKGLGFTPEERRVFGLEGLLPSRSLSLSEQVRLAHENLSRKPDALEKYIGLCAIHDRNEVLFYRMLLDHLEELLPIVYTPTVGLACQRYSHIFRRPHGLWITPDHSGRIEQVLANADVQDVRLIVVTDNERILGLGDLGAGGIGIPIGKLALYTVAAGIHPRHTLPISLDVGTDNQELLEDDLYLGWRHRRLRGAEYDALVEEFVRAVRRRFRSVVLQWEDFKKATAFRLLDSYRRRIPSFNDDIQGTAAIGVAAMLAASRMTRRGISEQRVLMVGAGAAGIGICRQLRNLFARHGMSQDAIRRATLLTDSRGLLHEGRQIDEPTKQPFAWSEEAAKAMGLPLDCPDDLEQIVRAYRPTVLFGTSGQAGVFTEPLIRAMAEHVERPVVLPWSNPNSKSEARPVDIIRWTEGRAIVATGSPFDPVEYDGRSIRIGQGNNVYVFPGIGLGTMVGEVTEVSDAMFTVAAQVLADHVTEDDLREGSLFPSLTRLREITARIAEAVVRQAREEGVGRPIPDDQIPDAIQEAMWTPQYPRLVAEQGTEGT